MLLSLSKIGICTERVKLCAFSAWWLRDSRFRPSKTVAKFVEPGSFKTLTLPFLDLEERFKGSCFHGLSCAGPGVRRERKKPKESRYTVFHEMLMLLPVTYLLTLIRVPPLDVNVLWMLSWGFSLVPKWGSYLCLIWSQSLTAGLPGK